MRFLNEIASRVTIYMYTSMDEFFRYIHIIDIYYIYYCYSHTDIHILGPSRAFFCT